MGHAATMQRLDIVRFGDDGLAHEHRGVFDALSMMQRFGAVPEGPGQSGRR